eukprot:SAG11_NODE_20601_length_442_cov_0.603499_1_plen_47_part_10
MLCSEWQLWWLQLGPEPTADFWRHDLSVWPPMLLAEALRIQGKIWSC